MRELVFRKHSTQACSEETVPSDKHDLYKTNSDFSDTEREQEGTSELRREETVEADLLAELDTESVGEGEVVSHQLQQPSEQPVTIEEDKLTTGVIYPDKSLFSLLPPLSSETSYHLSSTA